MSTYRLKGTAGPALNQTFPLAGRLLIGSGPDCEVRLEQGDVAARHAEVRLTDAGSVVLRNLDPGRQTLLNGAPVEEAELGSGDEIRVGQSRWMLQAPGLRPDRILSPAAATPARRWPWWVLAALAAAAALGAYRGWWP